MVRAILEGRKTMTRRVMKPQPTNLRWNNIGWLGWDDGHGYRIPQRYNVGDILWVRETWCPAASIDSFLDGRNLYGYKADFEADDLEKCPWKWHPSIHMPKDAARIFLRVTDVRPERVQDIDNTDAIREGVTGVVCDNCNYVPGNCTDCMNTGWIEPPIVNFIPVWNSTIKKKDLALYNWDANPWVWVITFERWNRTWRYRHARNLH